MGLLARPRPFSLGRGSSNKATANFAGNGPSNKATADLAGLWAFLQEHGRSRWAVGLLTRPRPISLDSRSSIKTTADLAGS